MPKQKPILEFKIVGMTKVKQKLKALLKAHKEYEKACNELTCEAKEC